MGKGKSSPAIHGHCLVQDADSAGKNHDKKAKVGFGKTNGKAAKGSKLTGEFATGVTRVKGENFYRDAKSAARVKMLNGGKAVRDRDGKIVQAAAFQSKEAEPGRVQPDKRWVSFSGVVLCLALSMQDRRTSERGGWNGRGAKRISVGDGDCGAI